jgi:hypothetical protein
MYMRKWDERKRALSSNYDFVHAKNIGWYSGMMAAPKPQIGTHFEELAVPGFISFNGDDFIALLGLIVSDGFAGGAEKNQKVVSFASFRNDPNIEALAIRCGFRRKESNPCVWLCTSHEFANWVRENCYCGADLGAENKCVPRIVKAATPRQIKIFLEYFDDRNRDCSQYYSGSKRLIDDLQELHMLIGKRSTIGKRDPCTSKFDGNKSGFIHSKLPQYVLTVSDTDSLSIVRKKHIEQDLYNGNVYCVTVPNGTVVTRRNGSVMYSGNCWAYASVAALMLARMAANMPYKRLSAHMVGCLVKNYRDEGGWGALALDFMVKNGVADVEHWPEKSMRRSNDTPAMRDNAKLYMPGEIIVDLESPVYDRDLNWDQVVSCLLQNFPVAGDFNFWGHAVACIDVLEIERGDFGILILNSWSDNWNNDSPYGPGTSVLRGNRARPDNAVAICNAIAS